MPQADERYKTDILVVLAHPDDEGAVTPYVARALEEHKRIAVVYGMRGSSGSNEAGAEQAAALGAVREIEARDALITGCCNSCGVQRTGHRRGKTSRRVTETRASAVTETGNVASGASGFFLACCFHLFPDGFR